MASKQLPILSEEHQTLIEANLRLVPYTYGRLNFPNKSLYREELLDAGYEALIKAAWLYDTKKSKFSSYAFMAIYRKMQRAYNKIVRGNVTSIEALILQDTRRREVDSDVDAYLLFPELSENPDYVEAIACTKFLKALVKDLTFREIRVLHLLMAGLNQSEIGKIFHCSRQNIGQMITSLRKKARKHLGSLEGGVV